MVRDAKWEKVNELLEDRSTTEIVEIYNRYCDSSNTCYDMVYQMEEFDEVMCSAQPWEIARACYWGRFNPQHNYFFFNGQGNLSSFDYWEDAPIYLPDIVDYILTQEDCLDDEEIREILESEDE